MRGLRVWQGPRASASFQSARRPGLAASQPRARRPLDAPNDAKRRMRRAGAVNANRAWINHSITVISIAWDTVKPAALFGLDSQ